jgi:hypothetical protein
VSDLDDAVRTAGLAVGVMHVEHREIRELPEAWQELITVRAALAYLHEHGMITVTSRATWPEWMPVRVPDSVLAVVDEEMARYRRINAALPPNSRL